MVNAGLQEPAVPAPPTPPALQQCTKQAQHILQLNWSQFKPEFSGKSEEDAEAHLLITNDWIHTSISRRCKSLKSLSNIRKKKLDYGMNPEDLLR